MAVPTPKAGPWCRWLRSCPCRRRDIACFRSLELLQESKPRAHGDVGDVDRPHMVRMVDGQTALRIRIDAMTWRRLRCVGPTIDRFDPHAPHQCCDMTAADLAPLGSQRAAQHSRTCERELKMQFVGPA